MEIKTSVKTCTIDEYIFTKKKIAKFVKTVKS